MPPPPFGSWTGGAGSFTRERRSRTRLSSALCNSLGHLQPTVSGTSEIRPDTGQGYVARQLRSGRHSRLLGGNTTGPPVRHRSRATGPPRALGARPRTARMVTCDLADCHVPVHADVPALEDAWRISSTVTSDEDRGWRSRRYFTRDGGAAAWQRGARSSGRPRSGMRGSPYRARAAGADRAPVRGAPAAAPVRAAAAAARVPAAAVLARHRERRSGAPLAVRPARRRHGPRAGLSPPERRGGSSPGSGNMWCLSQTLVVLPEVQSFRWSNPR